jgi:hypothetical protein
MKVLITGNSMTYMSGQPLYCYTLAIELSKKYNVTLVSNFYDGIIDISKEIMRTDLTAAGVECMDFKEFNGGSYNIAYLSELVSEQVINKINCNKIINIVHSEYECESPIMNSKICTYVAIRPSIKDHLINEHSIDKDKITIIYNGIDRERFSPRKKKAVERNYKRIVIPCTIDYLRRNFLKYAIKKSNRKLRIDIFGIYCGRHKIGKINRHFPNFIYDAFPQTVGLGKYVRILNPVWNIEDEIANADEVWGILLGRINLEANSMGVPSIIFDPANLSQERFLLSEKEFDKKHNIKNVANELIKLY